MTQNEATVDNMSFMCSLCTKEQCHFHVTPPGRTPLPPPLWSCPGRLASLQNVGAACTRDLWRRFQGKETATVIKANNILQGKVVRLINFLRGASLGPSGQFSGGMQFPLLFGLTYIPTEHGTTERAQKQSEERGSRHGRAVLVGGGADGDRRYSSPLLTNLHELSQHSVFRFPRDSCCD
jgi:hypothetical protein